MKNTMRIVGWNPGLNIFVQFKVKNEWEQVIMTMKEFENMMKKDFPKYWEEWEEYKRTADDRLGPDCGDFFFHYGRGWEYQTGETYIFA